MTDPGILEPKNRKSPRMVISKIKNLLVSNFLFPDKPNSKKSQMNPQIQSYKPKLNAHEIIPYAYACFLFLWITIHYTTKNTSICFKVKI